jgi:two-component system, LytTR family, response regulator
MNNFDALIIDDESLARFTLKNKLEEFPQINILGNAGSVQEGIDKIKELNPNLLFLDIHLGDGTGFDLLNQIEYDGKIIFVTAYDEYAIRAFDVNALDYIMKPVSDKRLKSAIEKLNQGSNENAIEIQVKLNYNDRILVTLKKSLHFIKLDTIVSICASREYTYIYTFDGSEYLTSNSIGEWENRLPDQHFCRIHRSTIINFDFIKKITPNIAGTADIAMQSIDIVYPISRNYYKQIKHKYKL